MINKTTVVIDTCDYITRYLCESVMQVFPHL